MQITGRKPMETRFNLTIPTPSLEINLTPVTRELRVIFVSRYDQVDVVFWRERRAAPSGR